FYKYPALVPVNSNIKGEAAAQPQKLKLTKTKTAAELRWNKIEAEGGKTIMYYVVYAFEGKGIGSIEDAKNIVAITADNRLDITDFMKDKKGKYTFTVTAVNKYKHESVASKPLTKRF
ncbi:MAG TPA: fibronectin type III domain-containing protein, partial [Paludibacteraceae bacterium]|nr:fibronectin type III domain-containing protein [Paludibacteraceae bacterium]